MIVQKEHLEKDYFLHRNVRPADYQNYQLPPWIKSEVGAFANRILDYGCGFGQNILSLKNEGYQNVFGVDIDAEAIQHCLKARLDVSEISPATNANPFSCKFDVIILTHVLEHIPKTQVVDFLSNLRMNFLEAKGKLLIAVPNAQSNTGCYWAYEDWTHNTLFTSGSLFYVIKKAGFASVEFLDTDCTIGNSRFKAFVRKLLLKIYRMNIIFWNKVTCSSYHQQSPTIFSYEIKAKANP